MFKRDQSHKVHEHGMFKRDQSHKVHEHGNDSNDLDMPQFDAAGNKIFIIWNYKRNNDK
jgi:hypothetical protein